MSCNAVGQLCYNILHACINESIPWRTGAYSFSFTHTTVDDHYNSNVQLRRTARVDANVAMGMQKEEVDQFRADEEARRRELEEKSVV